MVELITESYSEGKKDLINVKIRTMKVMCDTFLWEFCGWDFCVRLLIQTI